MVSPALESSGHQPFRSASLDQLDLWPLCLNVFDAQESRRDFDAVFEPLQSSRLCAKRPSCQSVVKTTNPNPSKKEINKKTKKSGPVCVWLFKKGQGGAVG